jgi:hypothetical protein
MSRFLTGIAASVVVALLVGVAPAGAATTVTIEPKAKRVEGGGAVVVRITVTCDPGLETLEAHVSVSQDEAFGMAGIPGPNCDGLPHRLRVRVGNFGGTYDKGEAFVSAFILRIDPATQQTETGQDSRAVRVR